MFKTFVELETKIIQREMSKKKLALVSAHDESALLAIVKVFERGYIAPILIGNEVEILRILKENNILYKFEIIDSNNDVDSAKLAVELAAKDRVSIIMKGAIQTSDLLGAVVNRETGIRVSDVLSHIALVEVPYRRTMYLISDGGMLTYPTYKQKQGILRNAIHVAKSLGVEAPKVALIDAAEHTNKHIPSSLDSEQLSLEDWGDACVEGPISLDLAVSKRAAEVKKYAGKIQGDADILITPDIISGNILGKVGTLFADGKMAGIIQGAKVPIVLTSRGSMTDEKVNSILLACYVSEGENDTNLKY